MLTLNALMDREPEAPLGPPQQASGHVAPLPALGLLEQRASAERPELVSTGHQVKAGQARVEARRSEARWPSLTVGADYWLMPSGENTNAYGAMVSINLPWLTGRRDDAVRAAEAEVGVEERELVAQRREIIAEVDRAYTDLEAAREALTVVQQELLPRAEHVFEAARARFASGGGSTLDVLESLHTWLEIRMDEVSAGVEVDLASAELERAIGGPIDENGESR
jgi:outer membrane protein TolC